MLDLIPYASGLLVTADAMHCQQESARVTVQEKGWDYIYGLKGNQSGVLDRAKRLLEQAGFPSDGEVEWESGHSRMERRRMARVAVTPEEIGLCGCWQVIAVRRERVHMDGMKDAEDETSYYASSLFHSEYSDDQMHEAIRGHWAAIENGTHYIRDVSFGEDACRISNRTAAHAVASLRNLAIGIYELQRETGRVKTDSCKSWSRQQTFSSVLKALRY